MNDSSGITNREALPLTGQNGTESTGKPEALSESVSQAAGKSESVISKLFNKRPSVQMQSAPPPRPTTDAEEPELKHDFLKWLAHALAACGEPQRWKGPSSSKIADCLINRS